MPSTASQAGAAAPSAAAVALPHHETVNRWGEALKVVAHDWRDDPRIGHVAVLLKAGSGNLDFSHSMSPAEARELAVYLVDCANALDNPKDRVIVDHDPEECKGDRLNCAARGGEECMAYGVCGEAGRCVRAEGEGIGHE